MPRAAVALASPSARPGRTSFRPRRLHLLLLLIAVVSVWLVIVFAKALGDVDRATARRAAVAAEAATLQARLDADHRELALVQTDGFQRLQARAYGMGEPGEIAFSLPPDAPPPPAITPLGDARPATAGTRTTTAPLDAWLTILFGN